MQADWTQRRRHMRVFCRVPIELIEPVRARLETVNLSVGGAYCFSPVRLSSGVRVTCLIRARSRRQVREDLQLDALVRRSQEEGDGAPRHMLALQFVEVPNPAESTLKTFLETIAGTPVD